MSLRIELFDGGEVLYIALDPDGEWDRSEFPDELVTLDYNAAGKLIGFEAIGSAARKLLGSLVDGVEEAAPNGGLIKNELLPALT